MEQIEFKNYTHFNETNLIGVEGYKIDSEHIFYVESNFYSQLQYLKAKFPNKYDLIINEMINSVLKNKYVIFTGDYEAPVVHKDHYVYQEIEDITNKLKIFNGFKSRGSDYGD
jgi:hypothetical protein